MNHLIKQLREGNFSCVIQHADVTRTFSKRGVADLYDLVKDNPDFLKGASAADKVVGKGAAALMVQGGVLRVHADLIGESALRLLQDAGVEVSYTNVVHHIENRDKSDWCPLEKRCHSITSQEEMMSVIDQFIATVRGKI